MWYVGGGGGTGRAKSLDVETGERKWKKATVGTTYRADRTGENRGKVQMVEYKVE